MTDEEILEFIDKRANEIAHEKLIESMQQGKLEEFFEDMRKKGIKEEKIQSLINQMIEILNKQQ